MQGIKKSRTLCTSSTPGPEYLHENLAKNLEIWQINTHFSTIYENYTFLGQI